MGHVKILAAMDQPHLAVTDASKPVTVPMIASKKTGRNTEKPANLRLTERKDGFCFFEFFYSFFLQYIITITKM